MAEESKNKKKLITGICVAVIAVVLVVVAVVLATRGSGINDSYFVSDDTKYVLTLPGEGLSFSDEQYTPVKTHLVYTYEGDKITGCKAYYEYADAGAAKAALDYIKNSGEVEYEEIAQDGKYVVITAKASEYESLSPDDVKQQIEMLEALNNASSESGEGEAPEGEATEEATEEVVEEEAEE